MPLNLIKLCVGCDTVEDLVKWRAASSRPGESWTLRTRQTPKRVPDLLDGGSLFRVYKGMILSRQRILGIRTVSEGGVQRCEVDLDETIIRTVPTPRRAFQGWRYLLQVDAPVDLEFAGSDGAIPVDLVERLRTLGAW